MAEIKVIFNRLTEPTPGTVNIIFGDPSVGSISGGGVVNGIGEKPFIPLNEGQGHPISGGGSIAGQGERPFLRVPFGSGYFTAAGTAIGVGFKESFGTGRVRGGGFIGEAREPSGPGIELEGEGLDPELAEQDEDVEPPFLPGVFEFSFWSVTLDFTGYIDENYQHPIIEANVISHPGNPGIHIEKLSPTSIRIYGAYEDLFDEKYEYMINHKEFITKTTRDRDPAWYLVEWSPPPVKDVTVHYIIEIISTFQTDQLVFPQVVYWSDTISLNELENIVGKTT